MRHRVRERSTRLTCWLGIVLGTVPARQASADTPLRELSLEELLEVEVVTPTAKPQPLRETPATVYVVTADMIRMRGYRHLGELLEDIPGIQIERNSTVEWADQFSMRGLIGNERFIIMLDGIRINSATNTPISIRGSYALNNIDRVEIVLGPGSAVYGADAFAGVIHMISRRGAQIDGGSVTTSLGRFRTTHDTFTVGGEEHGVEVALWGAFARSSEPSLPKFYRDDFAWYHDRYLRTGEVRTSPFDPPDSVVQTAIKPYTRRPWRARSTGDSMSVTSGCRTPGCASRTAARSRHVQSSTFMSTRHAGIARSRCWAASTRSRESSPSSCSRACSRSSAMASTPMLAT
jgi:hypothetical protein